MPWTRYDDALPFNRKVALLRSHGERGIAALGLHLLANTWSRHEGTVGFVPSYVPQQLTGKFGDKLAQLLVEVGMFDVVGNGWMLHDYERYGPKDDGLSASEKKERLSRVRAEAGRRGGLARAQAKAKQRQEVAASNASSKPLAELEQTSSPVPVPVTTEPSLRSGSAAAPSNQLSPTQRSKRITDAYAAAEPMCKWPAVNGIVLRAIKANRWTDDEVGAAVIRLANEGRGVTVETLRVELDGLPATRSTTSASSKAEQWARLGAEMSTAEEPRAIGGNR